MAGRPAGWMAGRPAAKTRWSMGSGTVLLSVLVETDERRYGRELLYAEIRCKCLRFMQKIIELSHNNQVG
jgi:hypothetical protein